MKKYIIKNCPAIYINHNNEYDCDKADYLCQNCNDCVLKRIYKSCEFYNFNYPVNQAIQMLTQNIENMLEIEECE